MPQDVRGSPTRKSRRGILCPVDRDSERRDVSIDLHVERAHIDRRKPVSMRPRRARERALESPHTNSSQSSDCPMSSRRCAGILERAARRRGSCSEPTSSHVPSAAGSFGKSAIVPRFLGKRKRGNREIDGAGRETRNDCTSWSTGKEPRRTECEHDAIRPVPPPRWCPTSSSAGPHMLRRPLGHYVVARTDDDGKSRGAKRWARPRLAAACHRASAIIAKHRHGRSEGTMRRMHRRSLRYAVSASASSDSAQAAAHGQAPPHSSGSSYRDARACLKPAVQRGMAAMPFPPLDQPVGDTYRPQAARRDGGNESSTAHRGSGRRGVEPVLTVTSPVATRAPGKSHHPRCRHLSTGACSAVSCVHPSRPDRRHRSRKRHDDHPWRRDGRVRAGGGEGIMRQHVPQIRTCRRRLGSATSASCSNRRTSAASAPT